MIQYEFSFGQGDCEVVVANHDKQLALEPVTRKADDIEMIYVLDFLRMLWNGEIF